MSRHAIREAKPPQRGQNSDVHQPKKLQPDRYPTENREAHRRLGKLQTIRAGIVAGLTEWNNRKNSGVVDAVPQALADATISHFTSQLGAVNEAIAQTIDNDSG